MGKISLEQEVTEYIVKFKEKHYRLAYSYVKNSEDALDVVQESIYKAFSSMGSLENSSYIKTWFYRIIVNTSLDFLRKNKKLIVVDQESLCNYDLGVTDSYEDIDLRTEVDKLPDNYKTIIILRYFENLKIEEIAEILNENTNTVKTRLYQGLKKLRIKMNDEEGVL